MKLNRWLESASARTFNLVKWAIAALSAAATSVFVLALHGAI